MFLEIFVCTAFELVVGQNMVMDHVVQTIGRSTRVPNFTEMVQAIKNIKGINSEAN